MLCYFKHLDHALKKETLKRIYWKRTTTSKHRLHYILIQIWIP